MTLRIWVGCLAALGGGVLMTLSRSGADAAGVFSGIAGGDALLIGAALLWSIQARICSRLRICRSWHTQRTLSRIATGDALLSGTTLL